MIRASIVTYNTDLDELETCLRCIEQCPQITAVDIIDNSENVDIFTYINKNFPDVIYIPNTNIGYGGAHNISIKHSIIKADDFPFHLVLNSDVIFSSSTIDTLLQKLITDESIGLIMPAVMNPDSTPQSCTHPLPSPLDLILHRFAPKSWFKNWRNSYDLTPDERVGDINVPYMHGCFMLFRTIALKDVGSFDERFFMYPEDIDITRRIHARYKTIATPDAQIVHRHHASSRHDLHMLFIHAGNMLKYFAKWGFFFDKERTKFNNELKSQTGRI